MPSVHGAEYRSPDLVPDGPVLVVGGGATGQQLALELRNAGREVILAVGRHSRAPRTYRGRDIMAWLHLLGDLDRTIDEMPDVEAAIRVPMFPLSGANGGEDLGLDLLASLGVTITGRLVGFDGSRALFADDLEENLAKADGASASSCDGSTKILLRAARPPRRSSLQAGSRAELTRHASARGDRLGDGVSPLLLVAPGSACSTARAS